jgi:hypothetical protein
MCAKRPLTAKYHLARSTLARLRVITPTNDKSLGSDAPTAKRVCQDSLPGDAKRATAVIKTVWLALAAQSSLPTIRKPRFCEILFAFEIVQRLPQQSLRRVELKQDYRITGTAITPGSLGARPNRNPDIITPP